MTRIYVTETDTDSYDPWESDEQAPRRRAGFFTEESATYWHGDKAVFDGSNLADVNTRDQNRGQGLYRTAKGRWVLRTWSNWQGEVDTYSYVTEDDARDWLIFNAEEDAAQKYFGEIEDERGPGRPEVGGAVHVRLGDLLPSLDAWASRAAVSRADAVREAVRRLLAEEPVGSHIG
ncbi:MAG TPA: hypothetical protein VGJ13_05420 [Pseudonocardiaceae bacterium]|jgi:hypothetical protein